MLLLPVQTNYFLLLHAMSCSLKYISLHVRGNRIIDVTKPFDTGIVFVMAFTEKVVSTLNQMYHDGMKGVGEQYRLMIEAACQQTSLAGKQVQV